MLKRRYVAPCYDYILVSLCVLQTFPNLMNLDCWPNSLLVYYRRSIAMGYKETVKRLQHQITLVSSCQFQPSSRLVCLFLNVLMTLWDISSWGLLKISVMIPTFFLFQYWWLESNKLATNWRWISFPPFCFDGNPIKSPCIHFILSGTWQYS